MSCDMTCAMKTEDALMSSSWLVCIFPEGALDLCGKEVAATRRGKKNKKEEVHFPLHSLDSQLLYQGVTAPSVHINSVKPA